MVGVLSNKIGRDELKPGDHIYSWRHSYLYAHHGIYVGDGNVIHFTRGAGQEIGTGTVLDRFIFSSSPSNPSDSPCPRCGDQSKDDGVISSCLECFLSDGSYINSSTVSHLPYFSLKLAAAHARLPVQTHPKTYFTAPNISSRMVSGFTTFSRTTARISRSTAKRVCSSSRPSVLDGVVKRRPFWLLLARSYHRRRFMTTGFGGLTAMGCGIYCISRIVSDIGVRRDVMKIPVERLVDRSGLGEPEATATENHKKE
ncbi:hypothetical protein DH2020_038704 [Rehmannia glutinosa]|uniref:LRAT domain-containing protein n=1 Tax=Rehmannia glutinosa TaxID=99300 RepID=A0ABR0UYZ9_REHGL